MERAMIFKDYLWTETGNRLGRRRFTFFLEFMERLKEEIELVDVPAARE
jgi:hypothetical protein